MKYQGPIVGTHAYVGANPYFEKGTAMPKDYEVWQRDILANHGNPVRFLVMPGALTTRKHPGVIANENVVDLVASRPDLYAGAYLHIGPEKDSQQAQMLGYMSASGLGELVQEAQQRHPGMLVGLKHNNAMIRTPITSDHSMECLEVAAQHNLPVMIHCGRAERDYVNPKMVEEVLDDLPGTRLVLAHMGGLNPEFMYEAADLVENHPDKVYLNTTGIDGRMRRIGKDGKLQIDKTTTSDHAQLVRKVFYELMEEHPQVASNTLFGTDLGYMATWTPYPVNTLSESHQRALFHDNAQRFYDIKPLAKVDDIPAERQSLADLLVRFFGPRVALD